MNQRFKSKNPDRLPRQGLYSSKPDLLMNESGVKKSRSNKPLVSGGMAVSSHRPTVGTVQGPHHRGSQFVPPPAKLPVVAGKSPFRPQSPKRLFGQLSGVRKRHSTDLYRSEKPANQSSCQRLVDQPLAVIKTEHSEDLDGESDPGRLSLTANPPAQSPNPQFVAEIRRHLAELDPEPLTLNGITFNRLCIFHPSRNSDFYSSLGDFNAGFCSSCAVKFAAQSLDMREVDLTASKGKASRKHCLDSLLKRIELSKPTFLSKKTELRTQKAALQKTFARRKETLEKVFLSLIDTLEKRKYLWDENLAQQFSRDKKAVDKQLETVEANSKCVDKIKGDIVENYQAIVTGDNLDNFESIFDHHLQLFESNVSGVQELRPETDGCFEGVNVKEIVERTEAFLEKELERAYNGKAEEMLATEVPLPLDQTDKERKLAQPMHNMPVGSGSGGNPLFKKIGSMKDDFFPGTSSDKVISRSGRAGLASDAMRRELLSRPGEAHERQMSHG